MCHKVCQRGHSSSGGAGKQGQTHNSLTNTNTLARIPSNDARCDLINSPKRSSSNLYKFGWLWFVVRLVLVVVVVDDDDHHHADNKVGKVVTLKS